METPLSPSRATLKIVPTSSSLLFASGSCWNAYNSYLLSRCRTFWTWAMWFALMNGMLANVIQAEACNTLAHWGLPPWWPCHLSSLLMTKSHSSSNQSLDTLARPPKASQPPSDSPTGRIYMSNLRWGRTGLAQTRRTLPQNGELNKCLLF